MGDLVINRGVGREEDRQFGNDIGLECDLKNEDASISNYLFILKVCYPLYFNILPFLVRS